MFKRYLVLLLLLVLLSVPVFQMVQAQTTGGTAVLAYYQEPELLNANIRTQTVANIWGAFMERGLLQVLPSGEFAPDLAVSVPSVADGTVSEDGLTITYNLKEGIVWSDGDPFDCDDVVFSYQAATDPDGGSVNASNYADIGSVNCLDPYTVEVVFNQFYAPYLTLFDVMFPSHIGLDTSMQTEWEYNRFPDPVLGPFMMEEWISGDNATLVRNEMYEYWESEGRPYLDAVVLRVVESREVGKQLLISGEVDFVWDLVEADLPLLEGIDGIRLNSVPGLGTERLLLNLRDPEAYAPSAAQLREDPMWHWALGDVRVRRAIELGIDKQAIADNLLYGLVTLGTTEYNLGWAAGNVAPSEFNPDAAMALLEEAGWTDEDGDGVRECHGCLYAEEGRALRLKYQTTSGNALREQAQQVILQNMSAIGVEFYLENVPSAELFASYSSGAFRKIGNFDILMYTTSGGVDPHGQMLGYYASESIPSDENGGSGFNYSRLVNDEIDAQLAIAGSSPDLEVRRAAYQRVAELLDEEKSMIFLYDRGEIVGLSTAFMGYEENIWTANNWNSDMWWLDI